MASVNMTSKNIEEIISGNDIVLIDFWASWCGPCRQFGPIFEKVSENHPDIAFAKVDTEAEQALAAGASIQAIPTLMAFRGGIPIYKESGALPEPALEDLIKQIRALDMEQVRKDIEAQQASAGE